MINIAAVIIVFFIFGAIDFILNLNNANPEDELQLVEHFLKLTFWCLVAILILFIASHGVLTP
jgi:Na+-driven multidrug efflux pump